MLLINIDTYSQNVYKTPSGKKYHLSSCRMVENVSEKITVNNSRLKIKLSPCKICKPPTEKTIKNSHNFTNKAVGESASVRCKGQTNKNTRCKHITKIANGYCYQHTSQHSFNKNNKFTKSTLCGAKTKKGTSCKRKVKSNTYCYQHK